MTTELNSNATAKESEAMSVAQVRLESIKSGLIGAATVGGVASITLVVLTFVNQTMPLPLPVGPMAWFANVAVAITSGFFFGVTYRYIVRQDDNLHLGSGAVGAFALVRSLAQIEALWNDTFTPLTWLMITGESFLWFAAARYTLDWAIRRQIVQPLD
ncbi:MAG: hypothetical protein WA885_17085 [Phormidesmis sp.]